MRRSVTALFALTVLAAPPRGNAAPGEPAKPRSGGSRWNVAIVVFDNMEILDFAGPAEVFNAAGSGLAYRVYTVAETVRPVVSQGFVKITPQYTIDSCPVPDLVVVPGGGTGGLQRSQKMLDWLRKQSGEADRVLTVCTGAFVAARAGLLDGLEATTHHSGIARLGRDFPKVKVVTDRRVVDNGKILTAAGVSAGIDGSLHVVARMCGPEAAKKTAEYMEYPWHPDPTLKPDAAGTRSPECAAREAWFAGDWKQAAEGYRQAVAKNPADGVAWFRLGAAQFETGESEQGIRSLERAAELCPRDEELLSDLARAQLRAKRFGDAARNYERAAELGRHDGRLLYNLACAYALDGQKEKALRSLERAFDAGFADAGQAEGDEDFRTIRDEPRFREILRKHGGNGS
jgi:putative intracellular protease/amidase